MAMCTMYYLQDFWKVVIQSFQYHSTEIKNVRSVLNSKIYGNSPTYASERIVVQNFNFDKQKI